jgi:hypothetical protein
VTDFACYAASLIGGTCLVVGLLVGRFWRDDRRVDHEAPRELNQTLYSVLRGRSRRW